MKLLRGVVLIGFAITSVVANAQESSLAVEPLGFADVVKVTLALVVVVAAIFGTSVIVKRMNGFSGHKRGRLTIVDGLSIGTRDKLLLVRVDHDELLLGISPGRISTLHELTPGAAASFHDVIEQSEKRLVEEGAA